MTVNLIHMDAYRFGALLPFYFAAHAHVRKRKYLLVNVCLACFRVCVRVSNTHSEKFSSKQNKWRDERKVMVWDMASEKKT